MMYGATAQTPAYSDRQAGTQERLTGPQTTQKTEFTPFKSVRKFSDHRIIFTPYTWAKLLFMRDIGPTEVGFFGVSSRDNLLLIEDLFMPKQKCTAAFCEFDDESIANFTAEMVDRGYQPNQFLRIWIHTHPGDSPNPSGQDESTLNDVFGRADWAIMYIIARGGSQYCRMRLNVGPGIDLTLDPTMEWRGQFAEANHERWVEEYRRNVTNGYYSSNSYATGYSYGSGYSTNKSSVVDDSKAFGASANGAESAPYSRPVYEIGRQGSSQNDFNHNGRFSRGRSIGFSGSMAGSEWKLDLPAFMCKGQTEQANSAGEADTAAGTEMFGGAGAPDETDIAKEEQAHLKLLEDLGAVPGDDDDDTDVTLSDIEEATVGEEEALQVLENLSKGGVPYTDVETKPEILLFQMNRINRLARQQELEAIRDTRQLTDEELAEHQKLTREETNAEYLSMELSQGEKDHYEQHGTTWPGGN